MPEFEKIEKLSESLKKYINTSYELDKLEVTERVSVIGANIVSTLLLVLVGALFVLFASVTLGFYISARLGNNYLGFGAVAGFYLVVGLALFFLKRKLVEYPLRDKIVWKVFSKS